MIVVVIAFSALASFVIPGYNAAIAIRLLRFPLILLSLDQKRIKTYNEC